MRIRSRLLLLVLAVLVPAVVGAAIGIGYIYREEQKLYRQSMRETARALALVLDREMATREAVLRTLAASPALDNQDFESFHRQAQSVANERNAAILLSDHDGRQIVNTRLPYGASLPRMLPMERALRSQYGPEATIVTNLYEPSVPNQGLSFGIQVPVMREGKVLHYLGMGSPVDQLQAVLVEQRLPPAWHAGIVDRNGVIVARSKEPEKYVGKAVNKEFARKLAAEEGFHEGVTLSGVPATAFFSRAPKSEWVFFVTVPKGVIKGAVTRTTLLMGGISLLLLVLALAAAFMLASGAARPIEALRRAAARLGKGLPIEPVRYGITEIDAVSEAMAQASEHIRETKSGLEQRINEAVSSAERSQRALLQAQKLEALGRLTGGIAHDFNNVLQTVATGVDVALLGSTDERVRSALVSCKRAVQRAAELTGQLAAFGRVQEARQEVIDPSQRLAEIVPLLKGGLRGDIALHIDVPRELWPVTVDPLQFELALLNLVINARDAMPGGGRLHLEARNESLGEALQDLPPGDYLQLSITDTGEGMTADVLAKALDPFFTTKRIGKGSGMGLPQAYGFAKQSNGTLVLHSTPGTGTKVLLYLPRAKQGPAVREQHLKSQAPKASGETVLLVEDDALIRNVVRPALEASGFHVVLAADGGQALHVLDSGQHVDLVFSDIMMPGKLNGIELAELVLQRFPAVRVLLATGYADRRVQLAGVRTLAKPYDVRDLVEALLDTLSPRPDINKPYPTAV